MITIKKKHNIFNDIKLIKEFSSVVRFSYNRILDGITKPSELEKLVKNTMNNISNLDSSWIKTAVKKSLELQTDNKLYFGGKSNFLKKKYNKVNNYSKLISLDMRGSTSDFGNRKAELDITNNLIIFKPKRGIKYEIPLNLSKGERKMLLKLENQCENKQNYFNIKIDLNFIWISFDETRLPVDTVHEYIDNRILGIDLNPNYIALSILDNGIKEVYKEIIDLTELNKKDKNKKQYELSVLNKYIINLVKGFHVEYVSLEDLNIKSKDNGKGKNYNRLVNNNWNRNYFVNNLVKLLNINGMKYKFVNPFYTSFIGQIKNQLDYDSIAASKEVAYRCYLSKDKIVDYVNNFLSSSVTTQWKEMLPNVNTYKDLYNYFKKSKSRNSYRFLFNSTEKEKRSYLRFKFYRSEIDLIRL